MFSISLCRQKELDEMLQKPEQVNWYRVSGKEWALPLLMKFPENVYWIRVSNKEWALPLLERYPDNICWWRLPMAEWALPLLMKFPDKVNWRVVSTQQWAFPLLLEYPERVCVQRSDSPISPGYIARHQQYTDLTSLFYVGPWVMPLLRKRASDLDWHQLNALVLYGKRQRWLFPLLLEHPENVVWNFVRPRILKCNEDMAFLLPLLIRFPEKLNWSVISKKEWYKPLMEAFPEYTAP